MDDPKRPSLCQLLPSYWVVISQICSPHPPTPFSSGRSFIMGCYKIRTPFSESIVVREDDLYYFFILRNNQSERIKKNLKDNMKENHPNQHIK